MVRNIGYGTNCAKSKPERLFILRVPVMLEFQVIGGKQAFFDQY
jgi:hypothetical protein